MCQISVSGSNREFEIMIDFCFVSTQFQFQAHDQVGSSNSYAFLIVHSPLTFFGLRAGKCSTYSDVCSSYVSDHFYFHLLYLLFIHFFFL
jgi:hypothetical protein